MAPVSGYRNRSTSALLSPIAAATILTPEIAASRRSRSTLDIGQLRASEDRYDQDTAVRLSTADVSPNRYQCRYVPRADVRGAATTAASRPVADLSLDPRRLSWIGVSSTRSLLRAAALLTKAPWNCRDVSQRVAHIREVPG